MKLADLLSKNYTPSWAKSHNLVHSGEETPVLYLTNEAFSGDLITLKGSPGQNCKSISDAVALKSCDIVVRVRNGNVTFHWAAISVLVDEPPCYVPTFCHVLRIDSTLISPEVVFAELLANHAQVNLLSFSMEGFVNSTEILGWDKRHACEMTDILVSAWQQEEAAKAAVARLRGEAREIANLYKHKTAHAA